MNARFKFRVWSSEQKKMYFWSDCVRITNFIYGMFVDHRMLGRGSWNIEQCTGLKDKNGKLIYEGDIVKQTGGMYDHLYIVEWKHDGFCLPKNENWSDGKCYIDSKFTYEVLGNIHENPELLED